MSFKGPETSVSRSVMDENSVTPAKFRWIRAFNKVRLGLSGVNILCLEVKAYATATLNLGSILSQIKP